MSLDGDFIDSSSRNLRSCHGSKKRIVGDEREEWIQANIWNCHCLFLCLLLFCYAWGEPFLLAEESPTRNIKTSLNHFGSVATSCSALSRYIDKKLYSIRCTICRRAQQRFREKRPIFLSFRHTNVSDFALQSSNRRSHGTLLGFLGWFQAGLEEISEIDCPASCAFWCKICKLPMSSICHYSWSTFSIWKLATAIAISCRCHCFHVTTSVGRETLSAPTKPIWCLAKKSLTTKRSRIPNPLRPHWYTVDSRTPPRRRHGRGYAFKWGDKIKRECSVEGEYETYPSSLMPVPDAWESWSTGGAATGTGATASDPLW